MNRTTYRSIRSLRTKQSQVSGRNFEGKITVRHRGGGHKQAYRIIDWNRSKTSGLIIGFEYDPQRTAPLVKLFHADSSTFSYILAPAGVKLFQEIYTYNEKLPATKLLCVGDSAPISFFETGDFIHAVEAYSGQGPIFGRSAGTFCQVRSFAQDDFCFSARKENTYYAKVRLPSGSLRLIDFSARATLGPVAPSISSNKHLGKAGRTRWLGWRPTVRGVARNPVDHPHGGGQGKTSGGRPSVTFNSWPTKGQPTRHARRKNKLILAQPKN
jgi:large subunit ribosomal protein L2